MNDRIHTYDITYSITFAWALITMTLRCYGIVDWSLGVCLVPFIVAAVISILSNLLRELTDKRGGKQ